MSRAPDDMSIDEVTSSYEQWMAEFGDLNRHELGVKHELMTQGAFPFLRATFYDWSARFPLRCPDTAGAPAVLGVGDLHVENFGLWRDAEGRLVWGINDFDEAAELPYTNDLVRLLTSAALIPRLDLRAAGRALLDGYSRRMDHGRGEPFVLAERHGTLRRLALHQQADAAAFWRKLSELRDADDLPAEPRKLLLGSLPEGSVDVRIRIRQAGL